MRPRLGLYWVDGLSLQDRYLPVKALETVRIVTPFEPNSE